MLFEIIKCLILPPTNYRPSTTETETNHTTYLPQMIHMLSISFIQGRKIFTFLCDFYFVKEIKYIERSYSQIW